MVARALHPARAANGAIDPKQHLDECLEDPLLVDSGSSAGIVSIGERDDPVRIHLHRHVADSVIQLGAHIDQPCSNICARASVLGSLRMGIWDYWYFTRNCFGRSGYTKVQKSGRLWSLYYF